MIYKADVDCASWIPCKALYYVIIMFGFLRRMPLWIHDNTVSPVIRKPTMPWESDHPLPDSSTVIWLNGILSTCQLEVFFIKRAAR
jgi:hypothetical protein